MTAARSRQRELVGSLQQTPMFLELCEHLTEKLPLSQLPSDKLPSKPDLVKAVHESTNVLADWRKDVKDFAGSLCDHAVSLHVIGDRVASEQAKALHQAKRPLLAAVDQHLQPIPPVLTADLLPLPIEEVFGTVQTWSREACRDVVVQSLLALEAMVEHDMMGLIEWTDVTTCKIHYFEHAIQQSISTTRHSTRTFDNVSQIIEERVRTRGRNNFAVIGHEHHLMNAEAHELGESRFPLPQRIHNLVHKIPDWLMPYVRVLEGDLILERVFRRDVATTRWEFEEVRRLEIVTDPRVSESAGYDADPAILLGPYVLTGWGQREIQREQRRRSQAIKQAPTTTSRSVHSAEYQKLKPWAQGITAVAM